MAKSRYNVITHGLSGKVGDLVLFRQRFGQTILGKIPIHAGEPSAKQLAVREKFQQAVRYAKASINDPILKAQYAERAGGGVTPFNLAFSDFFIAPVIADIITSAYTGTTGSRLEVDATDDNRVTGVHVSIHAADGSLIEEGAALKETEGGKWMYTATEVNAVMTGSKITAVAKDIPGNSTSAEKVL